MADPLRPISPQTRNHGINASEPETEAACLPPEPGKCEAPPNQSLAPPAPPAAPAPPPPSTEPLPSPRAVDLLVSRAQRRPPAADSPSDRAAARPLSPQAEVGVTRSGDYYADVAVLRGVTSRGDTFEFMSATAQGGAHNELSAAVLRVQSQSTDGKVAVTSEMLSAKAIVSARMLPGCDGPYVAAGPTIAQTEWTYRLNGAEEASLAVSPTGGLEGGICIRDKDEDGLPETCIRVGAGPFVVTDCSEAEPPREGGEPGTGGGPSRSLEERRTSRGAGGAPGY